MTCTACGDKPEKSSKDFTKAVIEIDNPEQLVLLRKVVIPASMGDDEDVPAVVGKYHNVILYYEANKHTYLYSSDGIPTFIETEVPKELLDRIDTLETDVDNLEEGLAKEVEDRANADDAIEQEIQDLKNSPDVVDIVGTYAELEAYDTSKLGDQDMIRVLVDETQDDASTYYRWQAGTQTWELVGVVGPYYTKGETDELLRAKQNTLVAGDNISISGEVISATDTTYSNFVGTNGSAAGSAGLVPAPATIDANKVLSSDGHWETNISANDATLTIKKNNTSVGTFTANAYENTDINIEVPTKTSDITNDGADGTSTYVETDELATVATSGSYSDLINTPTIGNATLTIQKNGTSVQTFTANSTSNATANITVPTKTSDLTNDGSSGTSTYVEASALPTVDTTYSSSSNNAIANSTVTNSLDRNVMTDMTLDTTASTTTVQLNNAKVNLSNPSSTTTTSVALPVASTTQAGIMNSATFDAVTNNTSNINALINGAVAITGLSANPSQSDLTTAWQTETGLTTLMNRAGIYDVTNNKVWTYYSNDTTWHAASNTSQVTINTFTNSSEGTIKGSTNAGQIFAENDGTGSVNGWDTLTTTVGDHTSKLSTIAQGAEVNVQSDWTQTNTNADDYIKNKPSNLVQDANYVHTDNNFTSAEKTKLDGIATGAEVNQDAFSNIKVGATTIAADSETDTLELVAGSNVTLTPDDTNDKVTIAATDTTYSNATTSVAGLMSASDKTKLDGIATGAEVNQNAFSNVKVGSTTVAADSKTDTLELVAGDNVTLTPDATNDKVTITAADTTYSDATTSASGLMSATDKKKVNAISGYYGTCTTAADTAAKVVTCSNFVLATGATIKVKFTNANTYNGTSTLNVNSTGANDITYAGTSTGTRYMWSAGEVVDFVYDGTNWVMSDGGLATTTYYGVTKLADSVTSTSTSLAATPKSVKTAYDLADSKPNITMTDTDPGEGSALAANNYIGVYGDTTDIAFVGDVLSTPTSVAYVNTANIAYGAVTAEKLDLSYSASEQATGETWINGDPIYRKTVSIGTLPNNATKTVAHGISNLLRVIKMEGYAYRSSDSYWFPLPMVYSSGSSHQICIFGDNTNIYVITAEDRSNITESYVTLYYTKSL